MSESVHKHRESAPETVRVAILTISDTRTRETDSGGDTAEQILREAGQEIVARQIVRDEVNGIRTSLVDLLANPEVDAVITTGGTGISGRDTTYEGYANFNIGNSLAHLGRCDEAMPYLDRREQLLGSHPAVDRARELCA